MEHVREMRVAAKDARLDDYSPGAGWIKEIREFRIGKGYFPKVYITLTFYQGAEWVEYTSEAHIPINIERVYVPVVKTIGVRRRNK